MEKKAIFSIANYRYSFQHNQVPLSHLTNQISLSDVKPDEVFRHILASNTLDIEEKESCLLLFNQMIEEVQTEI
jgi:hypothetical protein